jgi:WD40 repeat protein
MKKSSAIALALAASLSTALTCGQTSSDALSVKWETLLAEDESDVPIARVAISSKGDVIAAAELVGRVRWWRAEDLSESRSHEFPNILGAFDYLEANDEAFLANETGLVQIWTREFGEKRFEHEFPSGSKHADIDPSGRFIAYGGYVYDRENGSTIGEPIIHAVQTAVDVATDGSVLTAGFHDALITFRDGPSGRLARWSMPDAIVAAALSHSGDTIVAADRDRRIYLATTRGQEPRRVAKATDDVYFVDLSPDGAWFAVAAKTQLQVFQVDPFERRLERDLDENVSALAVGRDWTVVLGDDSGHIEVWGLGEPIVHGRRKVAESRITALAVHTGEGYVVAGSFAHGVSIHRMSLP